MNHIKRMDLAEFRDLGFLQEANRLFFHPLGLALEMSAERCGCDDGRVEEGPAGATYTMPHARCNGTGKIYVISGVWDSRDDPEGIIFTDDNDDGKLGGIDLDKVTHVAEEASRHHDARVKLLGNGSPIQTSQDNGRID